MYDPEDYLQDQECLSPSGSVMETSYASSEEGSPWFGLASLARSIRPAIEGVAHTINRSAKSLINELAELEYEDRERSRSGSYGSQMSEGSNGPSVRSAPNTATVEVIPILPLPWEICLQSTDENLKVSIVQKEDLPLKKKILDLSKDENVFTGPFNATTSREEESCFALDDSRVILIRRLLEIDPNLGNIHARVSGRSTMKETIFWKNYFYNCENLRERREKEINDQSLKRALHDDELDAELVGRPPASCTGFYPRTGKLSLQTSSLENEDRVIPALPNMELQDEFVMVNSDDFNRD